MIDLVKHPFLEDSFEVRWSKLTPECVVPDMRLAMQLANERVEAITSLSLEEATLENTFHALEASEDIVSLPWGKVEQLDSVMNSEPLRVAKNEILEAVTDFFTEIPLNPKLWSILKAVAERDFDSASPVDQRLISETLDDFRDSGADLGDADKAKLRKIESRSSAVAQKFSENSLDALKSWELIITDKNELAGLPASSIEAAQQDALDQGHGTESDPAYRFTLQMPSYLPVIRFLDSDTIREKFYRAFMSIGRNDPWDNSGIIEELLRLRHEKAQLLGKPHFPDWALARRMAGSGSNALNFVEDLHEKTKPAFDRENEELELFRATKTGEAARSLFPWESAYWSEKLKKERYAFDEEEVRPYFPMPQVLKGLFSLTETLFGVSVVERTENVPEVWHPEVLFYDITDRKTGRHMGSFYTDWFPRPEKQSGAWMNPLRSGRVDKTGELEPHLGFMAGNMNRSSKGKPALLTHREVETVFHEFGHLLHHCLGEVPVPSLNGCNVSWDFVELPSQIMENWCWERESLDRFARHYETGEPLPDHLLQKMKAARNFQSARFQMRQLSFGKVDLELHLNPSSVKAETIDAFAKEILKDYTAPSPVEVVTNLHNFGHLFSDPVGYASGYYSYKWSEVLDADAFTRFQNEGLLNAETGAAFRRSILSQGNVRDSAELYREFMGRDPDPLALLRRLDLLEPTATA